jgi:predicted molibdopterin-dependent oxidoreductase YjgC
MAEQIMAASPGTGVHYRTCPLCEAMCGLAVQVEAGRVVGIRPDHDDVWSKGVVCPKGATLRALHDSPDRVRVPMLRDGESGRELLMAGRAAAHRALHRRARTSGWRSDPRAKSARAQTRG